MLLRVKLQAFGRINTYDLASAASPLSHLPASVPFN